MLILPEKLQTRDVRVLLINQVFHPDPQATSQYLSRLAVELAGQGHEVTVLTGRRDYDDPTRQYPNRETWCGVTIIRVWNTGFGHRTTWRRLSDFLSFLILAFLRGLFLRRADVVIALTSPPLVSVLGGVLSALWQAKFIYWVMDLNPDEAVAVGMLDAESPVVHALEAASRWSLSRAQTIIVPDIYIRDRIAAKGIEVDKIHVIPLWAQAELTFDAEGRKEFRRLHRLDSKYVVMYAGNHTPCHPLDTLVEAARLVRDDSRIHFCFVGGGMEWGRLRDQAEKEKWGNVTFMGYQPFEELSGMLSSADAQVVVMGDPFVGIVHPCKIYNFLATQRPFIYIGPQRSHVSDFILNAGLKEVTSSYRHGEGQALAEELRRRAQLNFEENSHSWPLPENYQDWMEVPVLKKLVSVCA